MKPTVPLIVSSLLSVVLGMLHLVDDALYLKAGMPPRGFFIVVLILLVWLCGTLPLAGRRSGYAITLVGGLFGVGVAAIHVTGPSGVTGGQLVQSSGPYFFIFTLLAFAVTSGFSFILSVLGLWSLRRGRPNR